VEAVREHEVDETGKEFERQEQIESITTNLGVTPG